ncbi:MAG: DUF1638 domain-containing protein [Desulfohalobiaceae bacterium]
MIGVICCQVLEKEMRLALRQAGVVHKFHVLEWGLHINPEQLRQEVEKNIYTLQEEVDCIVLGFGRCQMRDALPKDLKVPIDYPEGEDCIGVLLGQERYRQELQQEAGTWFLTPGWAELGLDFVFRELQLSNFAHKGIGPLDMARRMLEGYTRVLLIDSGVSQAQNLHSQGLAVANALGLPLRQTSGTLKSINAAINRAV